MLRSAAVTGTHWKDMLLNLFYYWINDVCKMNFSWCLSNMGILLLFWLSISPISRKSIDSRCPKNVRNKLKEGNFDTNIGSKCPHFVFTAHHPTALTAPRCVQICILRRVSKATWCVLNILEWNCAPLIGSLDTAVTKPMFVKILTWYPSQFQFFKIS